MRYGGEWGSPGITLHCDIGAGVGILGIGGGHLLYLEGRGVSGVSGSVQPFSCSDVHIDLRHTAYTAPLQSGAAASHRGIPLGSRHGRITQLLGGKIGEII